MRTRGRIDASQRAIVQALRQAGASVVSTATIGDGFPDLVVAHVGRLWLVEVKDGAKCASAQTLTPAQVQFRATWRGPDPVTLTSVDEALALLRTPAHVCRQQHSVP